MFLGILICPQKPVLKFTKNLFSPKKLKITSQKTQKFTKYVLASNFIYVFFRVIQKFWAKDTIF